METAGAGTAPPDDHLQEQPIRDAMWIVARSEYVDSEPPMQTSLYDDPERLRRALDLAATSLREEVDAKPASPEDQKQADEKQAEEFSNKLKQKIAEAEQARKQAAGSGGQESHDLREAAMSVERQVRVAVVRVASLIGGLLLRRFRPLGASERQLDPVGGRIEHT
jgi:hypothetical protein